MYNYTTVVWLFTSNTNVKRTYTYDICHWTWYWFEVQVTACGDIIKKHNIITKLKWTYYLDILIQHLELERKREVTKQFYDNNLSGTNVDFQWSKPRNLWRQGIRNYGVKTQYISMK